MNDNIDDPAHPNYSWMNTMWRNTFGQQAPSGPPAQATQPAYQQYPTPRYDYPGWTPWQREVNGRFQAIGAGNVYDGIAPHFSDRYKPGFDPKGIPSSTNFPLNLPGASLTLQKAPVLKQTPIPMLGPFAWMASAEDILEQAVGKQIWDRPAPDPYDRWRLENTD